MSIVKKISKSKLNTAKKLCIEDWSDIPYVDIALLKKLKVKKGKNGYYAVPPKKNITNILKEVKKNLELLSQHTVDGDIDEIRGYLKHGYICAKGRTTPWLVDAIKDGKNVNCGQLRRIGKTRTILELAAQYPRSKVRILVPTRVMGEEWYGISGYTFVTPSNLDSLSGLFVTVFSDEVPEAEKLLKNKLGINYAGGFYSMRELKNE